MEQVIIECVGQICKIMTPVPEHVHREIWDACSERDPDYFKVPKWQRENNNKLKYWDGFYRLYPWNTRKFRIGFVNKISKILNKNGFLVGVKYNKDGGDHCGFGKHIEYEGRKYQTECADLMVNNRASIAQIATGGGKTYISSLVTRKIGMNTVFIVRSKDLLRQAYNDYRSYFPDADIKYVGDTVVEAGDITIVMIQSLLTLIESDEKEKKRKSIAKAKVQKRDIKSTEEDIIRRGKIREKTAERTAFKVALRERVVNRAKLVHIDECHMLGAETIFKTVGLFENAINICGWSATPRRSDGRNIHLEAAAGPVILRRSMKDLIKEGFLVPPIVRYIKVPGRMGFQTLANGQEYKLTKTDFNKMHYDDLIKWQVTTNENRHNIIMEWANYFSSNNKSCLIAVRYLEHGKELECMIPGSHFVHGEHPDRENLINLFRSGEYRIMISTLCKEGFNAPIIEGIIIANPVSDPEQIIGRGVRLNNGKKDCTIVHLVDEHKTLNNAIESCRRINDENEVLQLG